MVRVGFPGGPRLEWYDRNPLPSSAVYSADAVAPHAATQRISIGAPTGKKYYVSWVQLHMVRQAAATVNGRVHSYLVIETIVSGGFVLWANTVGEKNEGVLGGGLLLNSGQSLETYTADGSTGGAVDYRHAITYTEFNA